MHTGDAMEFHPVMDLKGMFTIWKMDAIGYSMGFIATKIVIEPEAMDLPFVFFEEMHTRNIWENLKPCKFGNMSKFQALWIKDGWEIPPKKNCEHP